jgi:hypothetical protein
MPTNFSTGIFPIETGTTASIGSAIGDPFMVGLVFLGAMIGFIVAQRSGFEVIRFASIPILVLGSAFIPPLVFLAAGVAISTFFTFLLAIANR